MKSKFICKAVATLVFGSLGLLPVVHAQVDSTGVSALHGTPRLEAAIPNQSSYERSWTMLFAGQIKCHPKESHMCARIHSDGSVQLTYGRKNGSQTIMASWGAPRGLDPLRTAPDGNGHFHAVWPTGQNHATGSPPTGWGSFFTGDALPSYVTLPYMLPIFYDGGG